MSEMLESGNNTYKKFIRYRFQETASGEVIFFEHPSLIDEFPKPPDYSEVKQRYIVINGEIRKIDEGMPPGAFPLPPDAGILDFD